MTATTITIMITAIVVTMQHITHLSCIGKDYEIINQFRFRGWGGGGDVQHITHLSCIGKDYEIINRFRFRGWGCATYNPFELYWKRLR